jgi:hypothetical protein
MKHLKKEIGALVASRKDYQTPAPRSMSKCPDKEDILLPI